MNRPRSLSIPLTVVGLVAVLCGIARAEVPSPDRPSPLRLSAGAAYLRESWSPSGNRAGAVFSGAGPSLELSIGKSVRPRLVVGGLWQFVGVLDPAESYMGTTTVVSGTGRFLDVFAGFADYTPNPRRGLHVGGSAGLLVATTLDRACCFTTSWGAALSVRAGYDLFVSRRWSIGALAQLEATRAWSRESNVSATSTGLLPTLALSFTVDSRKR